MPRDYLLADKNLPGDRGNPADLLVAGAMAAMFFTPLGGKVVGGAAKGLFRGALKGGKAAYGAARNITTAAKTAVVGMDKAAVGGSMLRGAKTAGRTIYGGITAAGRGGAKAARFIERHRGAIAPAAIGGAAVMGAVSAMDNSPDRMDVTFPGGMPADNLGATGDLTLALHSRR